MQAHPTSSTIVSDFAFSDADRQRLESALGSGQLILVQSHTELPDALSAHPEANILCTFRPPADALERAPGLKWIALSSAGADGAIRAGLVRPGGIPVVTTANGVHSVAISEFVFSLLLMWTRHWPELLRMQNERHWPQRSEWQNLRSSELEGATLGVIGLGAIGRHIARLGRAFGMRVIATRRSASPDAHDSDVDILIPPSRLAELLAESDYVVIAVPRTGETQHLIGEAELRQMKPTAFLVNIARGAVIDEAALIDALRNGAIAGAGLDVFEQEPLPEDSPLWTMPNVIVAPHLSGNTVAYSRRFTDLLLDNLERYHRGLALRNVVDAGRGY